MDAYSTPDLLPRTQFRERVLARDNSRCVICNAVAQDAHHIIERRLFLDGGYTLDNGASVCGVCHLAAEQTLIPPEQLREGAGITRIILPPHFEADEIYTKWGDIVLPDGRRSPGELFIDDSVQNVLREGHVLHLYAPYVKHPRTYHLPWSPGASDDDKILGSIEHLIGREVVVTLKLDGQNTSVYPDGYVHARSIDARGHRSQTWVKNYAQQFAYELPQGWRANIEDLAIEHSLHYDGLPTYAFLIALWDERNVCLSWDETEEWAALLSLTTVPVLYRGPFEERAMREFETEPRFAAEAEGYVVRLAESFSYAAFRTSVAKWVRPNHVETSQHWRHRPLVFNGLREASAKN